MLNAGHLQFGLSFFTIHDALFPPPLKAPLPGLIEGPAFMALSFGQPLLEIRPSEDGPVVRLLHVDTQIELPGRLSITADELSLKAVRGNVQIEASDEVAVIGEAGRLN